MSMQFCAKVCRVDVHQSHPYVTRVKVSLHVKLRLKQTCSIFRHRFTKISILRYICDIFGVRPCLKSACISVSALVSVALLSWVWLCVCVCHHVFGSVEVTLPVCCKCIFQIYNVKYICDWMFEYRGVTAL